MSAPNPRLERDFKKLLRLGMKAAADDVSTLVGARLLAATRKMVRGDEALDAMGERFYVCETRRTMDREMPAGFLAREDDVYGLAASMLMMPGWDNDAKEELTMGFEEVVNLLIGAFITAAPSETHRLTNAVEHRTHEWASGDDFAERIDAGNLMVFAVPLTIDDRTTWLGFYAHADWATGNLPPDQIIAASETDTSTAAPTMLKPPPTPVAATPPKPKPAAVAATPPKPKQAPTPAAPAPTATPPRKPTPPPTPGAAMTKIALIDPNGVLKAFIGEQLQRGTIQMAPIDPATASVSHQTNVLLMDPDPRIIAVLAALGADRWVALNPGRTQPQPTN